MGSKKCSKCGSYVPYRFVSAVQHDREFMVEYRCQKCGYTREFRCTEDYYKNKIKGG